jgi:hypothetical protein
MNPVLNRLSIVKKGRRDHDMPQGFRGVWY